MRASRVDRRLLRASPLGGRVLGARAPCQLACRAAPAEATSGDALRGRLLDVDDGLFSALHRCSARESTHDLAGARLLLGLPAAKAPRPMPCGLRSGVSAPRKAASSFVTACSSMSSRAVVRSSLGRLPLVRSPLV